MAQRNENVCDKHHTKTLPGSDIAKVKSTSVAMTEYG
jgi:hypothetical protein